MKEKDKLLKAIFKRPACSTWISRLLRRRKIFLSWTWCDGCETYMLICPKCGNNCCNAGYGKVGDKDCDICIHVYALQDWAWLNNKPYEEICCTKVDVGSGVCKMSENMCK